jgi:hypothetical protein
MSKARDLANAGTGFTTVSATELGYLDGVTSAIQTQITNRLTTATAATTYETKALTFNAQTGTTYTLVLADADSKLVTLSNASAITLTVPPSVFTSGQRINIQAIGAGQVTLAQGAGVTITSNGGTASAPKLRVQYSAATIICTGSNTFTVIGDLS